MEVFENQEFGSIRLLQEAGKTFFCVSNVAKALNPRDNFKLGSGTIKYITVKNLRSDGILDFSGCDTIDETARAIVHRRSDVCTGDILFASIAPLGRCHLIQELPQAFPVRPQHCNSGGADGAGADGFVLSVPSDNCKEQRRTQ